MDKKISKQPEKLHRRFLKAFTLLELIVVIAIISVLLAVIIPNTAAYLRDSKVTAANTQAQQVYNAVQDYLIAQQIRGEKACGYDGSENEIYIAAITSNGKTFSVKGGNISDDDALAAANTITGNEAIKKTANNGTIYDGYNAGYLTDGFEGAWLVCVYPKTYTVKYALFCDNYPAQATTSDKEAKRDVLIGMETGKGLYKNLGEQDADANNPSGAKRYVGQYPYIN